MPDPRAEVVSVAGPDGAPGDWFAVASGGHVVYGPTKNLDVCRDIAARLNETEVPGATRARRQG